MKRALAILLLLCPAFAQSTPRAIEVLKKFDQLAQQSLWPGFEPQKIAVELYDGSDTYLYHHPKPPEGFTAVAGAPGVYVFHGQHDSVRANTGTELNGVPTATADISKDTRPPREAASLLIHETFHVYEEAAHPKWAANEAELFTYPFESADLLYERRMETVTLTEALASPVESFRHRPWSLLCHIEEALGHRKARYAQMSPGAAGYERGIELNEGLAQYVEYKSMDKAPALTAGDFPLELIRQRGYATGQALAVLLDRIGSDWKTSAGDEPLDARMLDAVQGQSAICNGVFMRGSEAKIKAAARAEVAKLLSTRAERKHDFLAAPGWRLEIVAGQEPLWPQGFDPWNVQNLGDNDILHTRWVKVGNKSGAIEVLNHASMTMGVGPHPLFNGAKRLIVTGTGPVSFTDKDGKIAITSDAAKGTFAGASITQQGQVVTVQLP
ncbi:MAG TPA: hypothetical protein VL382_02300 [Terriglobales bacterium]|nr:hypothetical protein [Terriglobales bacterium]